ncbi:tubulin polymerization-promoting protein family member 2-like [Watersipora subatra]|uniref:tubulin polymerization-promoting protein family member 2-like n=1 Tax=Watersipora subatra TaxID=2589382 RepID=UPI00355B3746
MAEKPGEPKKTLSKQFIKFCNFGNHSKVEKTKLTDKNLTKLFKDCHLYGKALTSADTDIAFSKVKEKGKKEISLGQFKDLLRAVSSKYQKDKLLETEETAYELMVKTITEHEPGLHGTTNAMKGGVVNRMTDTSKYTGTHKERFDESGKGKGIAGREEVDAKDGYVQGYKERGTYDDKMKATEEQN